MSQEHGSSSQHDQYSVNEQGKEPHDTGRTETVVHTSDIPASLVRAETVQGAKLGDQRFRKTYVNSSLKRNQTGVLEATPETQIPQDAFGRASYYVRRFFIGAPLANAQMEHERLTRFKALAVLSSDAISSVAYATEAILLNIAVAGSGKLGLTLPICISIVVLLGIVALSYRQTIPAYPNGGGSYIVAKDNLGALPGLVAAAALLIDYVLTVSVSVASGVQNLASLFPNLAPDIVIIDVALIIVITLVNLRGVRESGSIFSIPTYIFIGSALLLIIVGLIKSFIFGHQPLIGNFHPIVPTENFSLFVILRSFAAGCTAMTGVEAISNGIPAFKKPEPHNAAITLTWMATILATLFIGITVLAMTYHVEANALSNPTVIAQIAAQIFTGPLVFMFPVFQLATLFILTLAANTSYSDFPRLSSILARDNYLPHQFAFRGDRLAFSIGIVVLAILSSLLIIAFRGDTTLLLNLYAVGVFMSFTLSQGGMVLHWWRLRNSHKGWLRSMMINGLGSFTTFVVVIILAYTKFLQGAWIVVILVPILVIMFELIHRHYTRVQKERTTDIPAQPGNVHHRLVVPIATLNASARQALSYARSISEQVVALHIYSDKQRAGIFQAEWQRWQDTFPTDEKIQLALSKLDHRSISQQILAYVDQVQREYPNETLTVVLPEVEVSHWWQYIIRNRIAVNLKAALLFRPGIVVTDLSPYRGGQKASTEVPPIVPENPRTVKHLFIVPIATMDSVSKQSLAYARSVSNHVIAVHVSIEKPDEEKIKADWEQWAKQLKPGEETELVVIESPYRSLTRPLLNYINSMRALYDDYTVNVLLPDFVVVRPWEYFLHNQTAFQLKLSLLFTPGVIVTSVPLHLPSRGRTNQQPLKPLFPV